MAAILDQRHSFSFYSTFLYFFFLYAYSTLSMIETSDMYFYLMNKDLFIYKISKFLDTGETQNVNFLNDFSITHNGEQNKSNYRTWPTLSVLTPITTPRKFSQHGILRGREALKGKC